MKNNPPIKVDFSKVFSQENFISYYISRWGTWFIMLIALIINSNTFSFDYAVDDRFVIQENAYIQKGIKGIYKILTTDSFAGFYAYYNNPVDILPGGRYRPLSLITFAIEHVLWGQSPALSHLINTLLYTILCGMLFVTLKKTLSPYPNSKLVAFLATLLFTLHPTHTEAVANIKGRDEILSLLFLVLSIYTLEKTKNTPNPISFPTISFVLISCFNFFLALLSKENGLMFLAIYPITFYYFFNYSFKKSLKISLPFYGVILLYIIIRLKIGLSFEESQSIMDNAYLWASALERYATMTYMLLRYLILSLFPYPLSWDYSYAAFSYINLGNWKFWASVTLHLALLAYAILSLRKRTIIGYGIWFYLFSIFIVSGYIVNIGGAMIADRFLFQPTLGATLAISATLLAIVPQLSTFNKTGIVATLVIASLLQSYSFWQRNWDWKNSDTLFLADADKYPESARVSEAAGQAWINYALSLKDSLEQKKYLQKAIPYLERAIQKHPQTVNGHLWLGRAYFIQNDLATTEKYWKKAESLSPNELLVRQCMLLLSDTYENQGLKALQQNQIEKSLTFFQKALAVEPQNASVHFQLGILYGLRLRELEKSIYHLQQATTLEPHNADYWYNLGGALITANKKEEARMAWEKTLSINPNHASAKQGLAALNNK
ncbi:MAG: tetratricopeptide repeat protein [Bacteroidia bacterium]|nr:tetratricopeptide repeat protein [Bacteroidia bacterium]MDW8159359.1 tetratricopeptide repeat protein [Bacteroidia bacterium]